MVYDYCNKLTFLYFLAELDERFDTTFDKYEAAA